MDSNPVIEAITRFGNVPKAVVRTHEALRKYFGDDVDPIPENTWYRWRRAGRIADPRVCFIVEELTGVPARDLSGLRLLEGGKPADPTPRQGGKVRRVKASGPSEPETAWSRSAAGVIAVDRAAPAEGVGHEGLSAAAA